MCDSSKTIQCKLAYHITRTSIVIFLFDVETPGCTQADEESALTQEDAYL